MNTVPYSSGDGVSRPSEGSNPSLQERESPLMALSNLKKALALSAILAGCSRPSDSGDVPADLTAFLAPNIGGELDTFSPDGIPISQNRVQEEDCADLGCESDGVFTAVPIDDESSPIAVSMDAIQSSEDYPQEDKIGKILLVSPYGEIDAAHPVDGLTHAIANVPVTSAQKQAGLETSIMVEAYARSDDGTLIEKLAFVNFLRDGSSTQVDFIPPSEWYDYPTVQHQAEAGLHWNGADCLETSQDGFYKGAVLCAQSALVPSVIFVGIADPLNVDEPFRPIFNTLDDVDGWEQFHALNGQHGPELFEMEGEVYLAVVNNGASENTDQASDPYSTIPVIQLPNEDHARGNVMHEIPIPYIPIMGGVEADVQTDLSALNFVLTEPSSLANPYPPQLCKYDWAGGLVETFGGNGTGCFTPYPEQMAIVFRAYRIDQ
jgi:hypothetical protein